MRRVAYLCLAVLAAGCTEGVEQLTEVSELDDPGMINTPGSPANMQMVQNFLAVSLTPIATETGSVTLSIDAMGTTAGSGLIQVDKPAGATVRRAYLFSATIPSGHTIPDGAITIAGSGVNWDGSASVGLGGGGAIATNYYSDVTALVKPGIDAAPAGIINLTITEQTSGSVDGEILAVIFDDPAAASANGTAAILFGALASGGDQFFISLGGPIDLSQAGLVMDLSLGIGFGFQGSNQFSIVDVNGLRMTSSAGGQDDGQGRNGALITAGGIGDTNGNPPPFAGPGGNHRFDDELYNLLPFIPDGSSLVTVDTRNPSDDDNILFAALYTTLEVVVAPEEPTNQPPVADAGADQTLEWVQDLTADLDGSGSSDPDGDALTFEWTDGDGMVVGTSAQITVPISGLGSHTFTLTVTDPSGASDSDDVTITAVDTTAPTVSVTATPSSLWPPNHKYKTITLAVSVNDACDDDPSVEVWIVSDEPDNATGNGDGNTTGDIRVTLADGTVLESSNGSPSVHFDSDDLDELELRAERAGGGDGRTYTIKVKATDASGNMSMETVTVTVAQNQS